MDNYKYSIWLNNISGLGNMRIRDLLYEFGTAEAIYRLKPNEIDSLEHIPDKLKLAFRNKNLDYANNIVEDCIKKNIDIIPFGSEKYPNCLSVIHSPPIVIYKKGLDFNYDELPTLAIVGTRKATPSGIKTAHDFAKDLSKSGLVIVSGMALGIDTQAHTGALKAGKSTIAVLGTGADVVYPSQNRELYEYITEFGAIITEYPPGTQAIPQHFPARNRIISALSYGTLVVEADLRSGSLITADFANDQGKDVFAIPNNINAINGRGTNQLIKEYAYMVTCVSDIVEKYVNRFTHQLYQQKEFKTVEDSKYLENISKLNKDEKIVVEQLSETPKYIDEIVRKTGLPTGKVNAILSILQIKDIVYTVPGNSYALKF